MSLIRGIHHISMKCCNDEEYDKVVNVALDMGLTNAFIQEGKACSESFIPAFDNEGV